MLLHGIGGTSSRDPQRQYHVPTLLNRNRVASWWVCRPMNVTKHPSISMDVGAGELGMSVASASQPQILPLSSWSARFRSASSVAKVKLGVSKYFFSPPSDLPRLCSTAPIRFDPRLDHTLHVNRAPLAIAKRDSRARSIRRSHFSEMPISVAYYYRPMPFQLVGIQRQTGSWRF